MGFQINTNIPSLRAQENLRISSDFQAKTIGRVTSGLRITSSGDDAAGLAIANGFRSDQAVLTQGVRNANDGLATMQTIDGGINNISQLLDRARTLATQSATGTFTGSRSVLNSEFQSVVTEINRQAQAIGLDTGGQFAKNLSVFIGGGKTNAGVSEISNGSVSVNLSASTVDAQSLGLAGVRAASATGTDLSTSSSTTNVQAIVTNATNKASQAAAGFSDFYFRGPGFSDDNKVKVSVNMSGVTNTSTLAAALNDAITSAGNGTTSAATAFKNANIKAVVVTDTQTDGTVKERIGFISSSAAFQVAAGDRMANAVLGNFSSGAVGKALENVFVGGTATSAGTVTFANTGNVVVRVQGGGLGSPVDLTLSTTSGTTTVTQALAALSSAASASSALQAAGITLDTPTAGSALVFRNSRGERLDVLAAGDTQNLLGLGGYRLKTLTDTSFNYTEVSGASGMFNYGSSQTLEFSMAGGAKVAITATVKGSDTDGVSQTDAIAAINSAINGSSALMQAGLVAENDGGQIKIKSTNGTAFRMNVVDAAAVAASKYVNPGNLHITAATNDTITINLTDATSPTGTGAQTLTLAAGDYADASALATQINTQIAANPTLSPTGAGTERVEAAVVDGRLVIRTKAANSTGVQSMVLGGTAISNAANIGVAAGTYTDNVFGLNVANVAGSAVNGNLSSAIVSANAGDYAIVNGTSDQVSISVNGATTIDVDLGAGGTMTATQVATALNADGSFAAVARAAVVDGKVALSAIDPEAVLQIKEHASASANTVLGFTSGTNSLTDKATANSGGAYQTEFGTNDDVYSFRRIRNGGDQQTVTITASDSDGSQHSLSVVLQNNSTARNAGTLDQALKTINDALQQSGDTTLKKVFAVKEQNYAQDDEGFRFMSTLSNFRVSVGTTANSTAASEIGAYDGTTGATTLGQGVITAGSKSSGGSQLDISSQSGAEAAVSALASAVSSLGNAQAVVGRGQNQLTFAINLAQSQISNIAAAESRIRDADLAQEAANLTKAQIVLQAGIAALAQANSAPQGVLSLLRG